MILPKHIKVFGDTSFRGSCPPESAEQATFFNEIRRMYPDSWGLIAVHPRNEGKKSYNQVMKEKVEGMTTGASDIIVADFFCELKRQDHTKSSISDDQIIYLEAVQRCGGFACIALGYKAAFEAFHEYLCVKTTRNG